MEVLAIKGPSHDACVKHAERLFVAPPRRRVLVVTRDEQNSRLLKKHGNILNPDSGSLDTETKITDANSGRIHVAFQDLLEQYRSATVPSQLEDSLYAQLS